MVSLPNVGGLARAPRAAARALPARGPRHLRPDPPALLRPGRRARPGSGRRLRRGARGARPGVPPPRGRRAGARGRADRRAPAFGGGPARARALRAAVRHGAATGAVGSRRDLLLRARGGLPAPARRDHRREPARAPSSACGDREALVVAPPGRAAHLRRALDAQVDRVARGLLGARRAEGRPGRHLVAQPRRVGAASSTRRRASARSWSTSTPPTDRRAGVRAAASRAAALLVAGARVQDAPTTSAMLDGGARPVPRRCERVVCSDDDWEALLGAARRRRRGRAGRAASASLQFDDPINIQYTSRHDRLPQGRDALAPQHPQQRLLHRRDAAATPRPTASASRCPSTTASAWCWATSPAPPTARAWSSPARPSSRAAVLEAVAGRALHRALRRADDVHRRARPPALRASSTSRLAAHRHHGRLAVPGRGDEARSVARMHMAEVDDLLRHDRDLAGVDPDRRRTIRSRSASAPSGRVHPHVEIKIVDPETGAVVPRGEPGELLHARLLA